MEQNKNKRIGIIGGGPAGLSAALYLQQKGYKHINILEKNAEVGGKALTVELQNDDEIVKNYELGAEYITYTYDHIFYLCKLLDETTSIAASIKIVNKTGKKPRFLDPAKIQPFLKIAFATIKYLWIGYRYRKYINAPII